MSTPLFLLDFGTVISYIDIMNTIKRTAKQAEISRRYLAYLVTGKKNASPRVAIKLERVTGINRVVWTFGDKLERKTKWDKYLEKQGG